MKKLEDRRQIEPFPFDRIGDRPQLIFTRRDLRDIYHYPLLLKKPITSGLIGVCPLFFLGRVSAKSAGAIAIVVRLPRSVGNSPVGRGAVSFVRSAILASQENEGIPVFLRAPRGPEKTVLAVEFNGFEKNGNFRVYISEESFKR